MPRFEEGFLVLDFDRKWHILKLDEHRDYRERMERVDETKAVDFAGILSRRDLYLIEVKDFRQYRIETQDRLSSGELAIELAQKVRDSVACIIGAHFTSSTPEDWKPFAETLCNQTRQIRVVLWLEHDLPSHPQQRKKALDSIRANVFKQKLAWLTKRILVCGSKKDGLPGLQVSNLPR